MKSFYCLVLIFNLLFVKNISAIKYVYMTPYQDSDCSGEQSGLGFGFQVGSCAAVGSYSFLGHNLKVTLDSTGTNATITEYKDDDATCQNSLGITASFLEGGCYDVPAYAQNNLYNPFNYVKVTIGPPGATPEYGYRYSIYSDSNCLSNVQWYYFYTNATVEKIAHDDYYMWYCGGENEPYMADCPNGPNSCASSPELITCQRNLNFLHEKSYFTVTC